jgi:hypothetical protein
MDTTIMFTGTIVLVAGMGALLGLIFLLAKAATG